MEPVKPCELKPGERIRVKTTFLDFDGDEVAAGTVLTFRDRNYFPYDGGHVDVCGADDPVGGDCESGCDYRQRGGCVFRAGGVINPEISPAIGCGAR